MITSFLPVGDITYKKGTRYQKGNQIKAKHVLE